LVDPGSLVVFLAAVLVICVTPGPDMLFILSRGLTFGTRAGLLSALGMSAGMIVHTTAVSLGLAAVLKSSPVAYDVLRYAGAAYLLLMAWRSVHDSSTPELPADAAEAARSEPRMFGQAVLTNVLNPKIVLFYLAFLPQFVRPSAGRPALQLLVLGLCSRRSGCWWTRRWPCWPGGSGGCCSGGAAAKCGWGGSPASSWPGWPRASRSERPRPGSRQIPCPGPAARSASARIASVAPSVISRNTRA
jgi:threonine/homoserine/homoserine lactone efflux protein